MDDSILNSVKKVIGIEPDYTQFDADIIMHINSVLLALNQIGVNETPLIITSDAETWDDIVEGRNYLEPIKSYVALKVRMMFDPPTSSSLAEAINANIKELEWRISVAVDPSPAT